MFCNGFGSPLLISTSGVLRKPFSVDILLSTYPLPIPPAVGSPLDIENKRAHRQATTRRPDNTVSAN